MSTKQDRVAPRTAEDIERRNNYAKSFAEAVGIAKDARETAEEAKSMASDPAKSLTADEVFNILTNNGALQGIFRGEDGEIYINASYLRSGIISSEDGSIKIDLTKGATQPVFNTGISTNGVLVRGDEVGTPVVFEVGAVRITANGKELDTLRVIYYSSDGTALGTISETFESSTYEPTGITQRFINKDDTKGFNLFSGSKIAGIDLYNGSISSSANRVGRFIATPSGSILAADSINPGKKVLFTGNVAQGETAEVPLTSFYDLFAIRLGNADNTYQTVCLAYKVGNVIRGVGGWSGTSSHSKELYFFSATFSGDTWTLEDAGVHTVKLAGTIEAGTQLNLKSVIGII